MALKAPFRKCVKCGSKLPPTDGHSLCVICLGEGHKVESCHHCMAFTKQTRKNRSDRLRSLLWEKALRATDPIQKRMEKTPSTSADGDQIRSFVVSDETVAENRAQIPLTPGRTLATSAAKKIYKKARTSKHADEQAKKKKKRKASDKTSSPRGASIPPSTPKVSTPAHRPRAASLPKDTRITVPSKSPVRVTVPTSMPISRNSLSEGEILDSASVASAHTAEPRHRAVVQPPSRQASPLARGSRRSPRSDWDIASQRSQRSEIYGHPGYYDWEYYRPRGYYPDDPSYGLTEAQFAPPHLSSRILPVSGEQRQLRPSVPTPRYRDGRSVPTATASAPPPQQDMALQPVQQPIQTAALESPDEDYRSDSESVVSIAPSMPSPEDQVNTQEPASPSEDMGSFAEHVLRMARALGLDIQQPTEEMDDPIYDVFHTDTNAAVAIPFPPTLRRTAQISWKTPSATQPTSKRLESMYRVQEKDADFLFQHPKPNSMIVESAQGKSQRVHTAPVDREGRKLDFLGRKIYSSSSLGLRAAAYEATMARYQVFLWEKIGSLCDYLPEDKRELARVFQAEASAIARQQLSTARHQTDCHSKSMMGSVALRRHAWLRSANLPQDTKNRIESLPFDGEGLFNNKTDESLDSIYKARTTAKKMAFSGPSIQYRQRQWPRQPSLQLQQRPQFDRQPRQQQQSQRKRPYQGRYQQSKRQPDFSKRQRL